MSVCVRRGAVSRVAIAWGWQRWELTRFSAPVCNYAILCVSGIVSIPTLENGEKDTFDRYRMIIMRDRGDCVSVVRARARMCVTGRKSGLTSSPVPRVSTDTCHSHPNPRISPRSVAIPFRRGGQKRKRERNWVSHAKNAIDRETMNNKNGVDKSKIYHQSW